MQKSGIYCFWESLGSNRTKLEFFLSFLLGLIVFPLALWIRTGDDIIRFTPSFVLLNTLVWGFIVAASLLIEWRRHLPLYFYAFNTTAITAVLLYLPAKWTMDNEEVIPLTTAFIMILMWTPLIHLKERILFHVNHPAN